MPYSRDRLWIRCVSETKRGRESRLARLPGLAAAYGSGNPRVAARHGTARRCGLWRPALKDPILDAQIRKRFKIPIGCQNVELVLSPKNRK
jgi:hypothetical protein